MELLERGHGRGKGIARQRFATRVEQLPDIVDAVAVVGMVMSPQDRVDCTDVGGEELEEHRPGQREERRDPEPRRGDDEHVEAGQIAAQFVH